MGSVLAAVGTALPETMIPIIAILFGGGGEAAHEVGVGAILGAPFMLSTLAMFVTGVGVIVVGAAPADRRRAWRSTPRSSVHDIRYFVVAYAHRDRGAAFLPLDLAWPKWVVAVVLLGIYAWYVKGHFEAEAERATQDDLAPLRFHRLDRAAHRADPASPRLRIVNLQVLFALGLHRRRRVPVRRRGRGLRPRSASTRCCSRWSSRRSRPSCPRSSTR